MKRELARLATIWMLAAVCSSAWADAKLNPFGNIAERNPFGLRPPPPPVEPPAPIVPPPSRATVEVTGITSILSNNLALLEIIPGPGKPMIRSILGEGERVESIEVVEIHLESNEVVLRNGGMVTNVSLRVAKSSPLSATKGIRPVSRFQQSASYTSGAARNGVTVGGPVSQSNRPRLVLPRQPPRPAR